MIATPSSARTPRKGFALGLWAMICGIVGPVWGAFAILFWIRGGSQQQYPDQTPLWPDSLGGLVLAFEILGVIVVPLAILAAVVLGIVALVRNRAAGQVMGGLGLLALLLSVIGIVALIAWLLDGISRVSG